MRAALAITAVLAGCGSSRPAARAPVIAGQAATDPAADLLAFVPPDVSFVFVRDQEAGINDRFNDTTRLEDVLRGFRAQLGTAPGTGQAFAAALLDDLLAAGSQGALAGWREGESVFVVYGLGFDTVMRASLDGATLKATLDRAAAASKYQLTASEAKGRAYYRVEIPTPAFTVWLLLAIDDHGVVAAVTGDPDRLTEHVLAAQPAGPRFDTAAVVAGAYPDRRPGARFSGAMYPARLAAALEAVVARHPAWLRPVEPCAAAAVGLLAATPAFTMGWIPSREGFEAVAVIDADGRTIDRLGRAQRPLPRWHEGDGRARLGLGVSPATLVGVVEPWFTAFDATATACGSRGDVVASLHRMLSSPPVALVDTAVVEWDPRTQGLAGVVAASDLQALWGALRGLMPLRPQPPAPLERISLPGLTVMGGADAIGIGIGDAGGDALTELMGAEPGPRDVLALDMGHEVLEAVRRTSSGPFDNMTFGSFVAHTRVRDHQLVLEMRATPPPSKPQLAH